MLIAFIGVCVFAQWAVWSAKRNDRGHTVFALVATVVVALLIINAQAYIYSQMDLGIADGHLPGDVLRRHRRVHGADDHRHPVLRRRRLPLLRRTRQDNEIVAAHAMYWYTMAAVFTAIWFVVYVTK